MAHRVPFDIKKPLVAAREFTFAGEKYEKGEPFPKSAPAGTFNARLIKRQYDALAVNHEVEADPALDPVQMKTGPRNGSYTITAPWLEQPEVVRGKVNAEARLAEIKADGAPLGFIEGGSEVTVEGGEGGWFEVNAPWLSEPEKVQGREAAEARQRFHHDGKPEGFEPADPEADRKAAYEAATAIATITEGEGDDAVTTYQIAGDPPESFETEEAALARQTELRDAGPPEGWEAPVEADQEGEGGPGAETPAEGAEGAETATGDDTGGNEDAADPHKGKAEKVPGTGPAKAADDVKAAAGKATMVGAGEPAAD